MEDLRAKFFKRFADLPLGSRSEIIVVIDSDPFTWRSAWIEVEGNTKKGGEILRLLKKMGML